jgi:hypothetical protein
VIEEYGSTTVIGPGDRLIVDELGQLIIDLAREMDDQHAKVSA